MKRKRQFIKLYYYYKYSANKIANEYNNFMNSICLECKCYSREYRQFISLYQNNTIDKFFRVERIKHKLYSYK